MQRENSATLVLEFPSKKFLLTAALVLSRCSDLQKTTELLAIYSGKGAHEMLQNVFSFVVEHIPRLVLQVIGKSEKITNICDVMQKRQAEVLDTVRKEVLVRDFLTRDEFVRIFSEELFYLLDPQGVRNALLPYFINHSFAGSTFVSIDDGSRKGKTKKVTFLLD